jgi:membrane protein implicated in regulation of membrane protease activity
MRDWLWLAWLAVAIGAGVAEVTTLHLIFAMVAGGALAAAAAALVTGAVGPSVLVFAAATVVLLLGARPPLLRYLRRTTPVSSMNVAALVGRTAEVITEVTQSAGTVRLGGEVWTARAVPGSPVLESGSAVQVVRIDGATAVVENVPHTLTSG